MWSYHDKIVLPLTLLAIVLITIVFYFLLRNKSEKIKNIPLMSITIIILVLEVVKQIYNIIDGYSTWTIPLHFCSLFLYFYPLATLLKGGKVKDFGITMSFVCSLWMTSLFYFNPGSIIGGSTTQNLFASFSSFHTFFYHHLVILFLLTGLSLNMFKLTKKSFIYVLIGFSLYALFGVTFAHLLQTNYCNLLVSNIGFMETLRVNVGQVLYTIIMYLLGTGLGMLACLGMLGIQKLKERK